jgi:nucleoid-associated protein YgaU
MIAPQNDGSTQVWSATNPGQVGKSAPKRSVVVTNAPPSPAGESAGGFQGTNAILSDDDDSPVALERVPDIHLVRRGDTLWDLCNRYYRNPWAWPKVWSYNPQVANPHWIYPGDQLRLTNATGGAG